MGRIVNEVKLGGVVPFLVIYYISISIFLLSKAADFVDVATIQLEPAECYNTNYIRLWYWIFAFANVVSNSLAFGIDIVYCHYVSLSFPIVVEP